MSKSPKEIEHPVAPLLTTSEVAAILRVSKSKLDKWRVYGGGPRFVRVARRVRYTPHDVASYIAEATKETTSAA